MNATPNISWNGVPVPRTGHAFPQTDDAAITRTQNAMASFSTICVPNQMQERIAGSILTLTASSAKQAPGTPKKGARLSQLSQAGKTTITKMIMQRIHEANVAAGIEPNPHRVLYVELKGSTTLNMIIVRLLKMLGDPHSEKGNFEDRMDRLAVLVRHKGVELLIIDEVQVLEKTTVNRTAITDELRGFLNAGLFPIFFIGDERSAEFFKDNEKLSARLGMPLELNPIQKRADATFAKTFCTKLDLALVNKGCVTTQSQLGSTAILNPLLEASGGHIGRICRIVENALEHAVSRDADFVEPYDLWLTVEAYAIPNGFCNKNPFDRQEK